MKCLIIAAGRGERLKSKGMPKPLIPVLGLPLIERVILTAARAGVESFYVVTGYEGGKVRAFLNTMAVRRGLKIVCIDNPDWREENGVSVLKARSYVKEPFLLLMSDHITEPKVLKRLVGEDLPENGIRLVIDERLEYPLVDVNDVTKVKTEAGRVVDIGKNLQDYNAYDTGIFLCTPAIFDAIEESIEKGDKTLSGGVRVLARRGRVATLRIEDGFWIDVDDVFALRRAEKTLLQGVKKPTDGLVARILNRPISIRLTRYLVTLQVTPNGVSVGSFLLSILAATLFLFGRAWALIVGGFLAQFASIVDGCDGEIARLTFAETDFGKWFDAVLDRYADGFLIAGMTYYVFRAVPTYSRLFVGFFALIGSFVLSYTADKYDALMRKKIVHPWFRIGRDVRVFILFLGAITLHPFWSLGVLAVLMNLEVARRITVAYKKRHN